MFLLIFLLIQIVFAEQIVFWTTESYKEPNYVTEISNFTVKIDKLEKEPKWNRLMDRMAARSHGVWKFLNSDEKFIIEPSMSLKEQYLVYKRKWEYLTCKQYAWLFDYPREFFGDGSLERKYWFCRDVINPPRESVGYYLYIPDPISNSNLFGKQQPVYQYGMYHNKSVLFEKNYKSKDNI